MLTNIPYLCEQALRRADARNATLMSLTFSGGPAPEAIRQLAAKKLMQLGEASVIVHVIPERGPIRLVAYEVRPRDDQSNAPERPLSH